MPASLLDQTLRDFLGNLSTDQPTPGGGAVAALAGALAAALGQMAAALTVGRPRFAASENQVQELAARLKRAEQVLRTLLDADAAAYEELRGAFKLPREDATRPARIREAAGAAAAVPFQVAALAQKVRLDLARLAPICNPNLASDVQVGLHLAAAAMHSAAIMVRVNLPLLDEAERVPLERELNQLVTIPAREPR
jgi:formiminotetrahydrofolate cyclodeaminase